GQGQSGYGTQRFGGQDPAGYGSQGYGGQGQPIYGMQQPSVQQGIPVENVMSPPDTQGSRGAQPGHPPSLGAADFSQLSPFIQQKPFSSSKYADESADHER
ncbi:hypothetical protein, partial [Peribacillus deserti]